MIKYIGHSLWMGIVLGYMALSPAAVNAQEHPNDVRILAGENGLQSVKTSTAELLSSGELRVSHVLLRDWDGTEHDGDVTRREGHTDTKRNRITLVYDWGVIQCLYTTQTNRVDMAIQVTNSSQKTIKGVSLALGSIHLPESAKGLEYRGQALSGVGAPGVVLHDWGGGTVALCHKEVGRPLYVGLLATGADTRNFDLQASTYREDRFPRGWLATPQIDRPLYPGDTDHFTLSLRFGPTGASAPQLAGDIFKKYGRAFPPTLQWNDRRPIGTLHLGAVEYRQPKNPRGWFDNATDTTTPQGRADFQKRLMEYAENAIGILKGMNAQGMIVWDIEGDEYPHATTYIGDPRSLPAEIAPVIDAFFKKFTDAGLRVGICIRPSYPVRSLYGSEAWQMQVDDPATLLNDKIAYARKRWGCAIFYVDSNVNYDPHFKPNDERGYELMSATVFQRVAAANPDILLMPEQKDARYYAYSAPYMELRQGYAGTPERVRALYPEGFSMIYVPDGSVEQHHQELLAAVKHGDILLFRAWFADDYNKQVTALYREARK